MRYHNITKDDMLNGEGLRTVLWVAGCSHNCPGCHNPETHDPAGGREASLEELAERMLANPLTDGVTLSGGEPFLQAAECAALARIAREKGLNVWTYTGYTWEALWEENDADKLALLKETDVLVDGPFLLAERSLELQFCGSRNQRLIDVKKSLAEGKVVLWEKPKYF